MDTLQDLFLAVQTLARFRGGHDGTLTIVTHGSAAGAMAADAVRRQLATRASEAGVER